MRLRVGVRGRPFKDWARVEVRLGLVLGLEVSWGRGWSQAAHPTLAGCHRSLVKGADLVRVRVRVRARG